MGRLKKGWERGLLEILGGDGALLAVAEEDGVVDDAGWVVVEAERVAIWAHGGAVCDDGVAALADFVALGVGRDLCGLLFARELFGGSLSHRSRGG